MIKYILTILIVILTNISPVYAVTAIVDFSGFGTSENFVLAEAKDGISATTIACSISTEIDRKFNEEFVLKCNQVKTTNLWESFIEFTPSNSIIVGVYVQFDRIPTNTEDIDFIQVCNSAGTAQITVALEPLGGGTVLRVRDVAGNLVDTHSTPFSQDTWHLVEVRFQHSNTSTLDVHIDGTSVMTAASEDFFTATDDLRLQVRGQEGNPLGSPTTTYFNSYYVKNDASDNDDFVGEFKIERFQMNLTGTTPDNGDTLDGGDWAGTSDEIDAEDAEYTGNPTHEGYVIMDDFPDGGPKGKVGAERTIHGAKFTWWAGTFSVSNFTLIYGNDLVGGGEVTTTATTGKRMAGGSPWNIVQDVDEPSANRVPDSTEHFLIGFGCVTDFNGRAFLREAWCFLMTSPPVTTVHIKGGAIKGGLIQ